MHFWWKIKWRLDLLDANNELWVRRSLRLSGVPGQGWQKLSLSSANSLRTSSDTLVLKEIERNCVHLLEGKGSIHNCSANNSLNDGTWHSVHKANSIVTWMYFSEHDFRSTPKRSASSYKLYNSGFVVNLSDPTKALFHILELAKMPIAGENKK